METIWKLIETCIIPILTYGCETWDPTQKELKELNKILEHIIKRILMIPTTTPRESLYKETGLKGMQFYIDKNRLNFIIKRQMPGNIKAKHTDYLVYTDISYEYTEKQIDEILSKEGIK